MYSISLIKFLENIGVNKLTIKFSNKNLVKCKRCKHAIEFYEWETDICVPRLECHLDNIANEFDEPIICADFEKKSWWKFWR